ncbi:hypothetical protein MKW98_028735 [Papaver atlanticum]|uniref:Protein kinase domain-containing protein n=1 Tax=Papaver atlanticum TaxID=357466 RepID=A0AAD4SAA5_9MAGN|nr:hypothetical protein MKW98_028735 [Papaver atlanticum]
MAYKNSGLFRFWRLGGSSSSDAEDYTAGSVTKFKYRQLEAATNNFAIESLLGEGEHGRTYKGRFKSTRQVVAVKQVNGKNISDIYRYSEQSILWTIHWRSLLHHPNIVDLIGYCSHEDQILFVYDFMLLGSLKDYLHDLPADKKPLDWNTRMKIAAGAAEGVKHLHDLSSPSIIHGNIKPSNILLCEGYHPRFSDFFGFKEYIPEPDESESVGDGKLTKKSDIYSFGFVLLELISGRNAEMKLDLIEWAKRKLVDGEEFTGVADPLLKGHYQEQRLYQVLYLAADCLETCNVSRPCIGHVVNVPSNLASEIYDPDAIQINLKVKNRFRTG